MEYDKLLNADKILCFTTYEACVIGKYLLPYFILEIYAEVSCAYFMHGMNTIQLYVDILSVEEKYFELYLNVW